MPWIDINYHEYICSDKWRRKANAAKQRAGYRCRVCNKSHDQVTLDAHHRTYERLGDELPGDITVLCRDCHKLYETNKKLPRPPTAPRKPAARPQPQPQRTVFKPSPRKPATKPQPQAAASKPKRRSWEDSAAWPVWGFVLLLLGYTAFIFLGASRTPPSTPASTPTTAPAATVPASSLVNTAYLRVGPGLECQYVSVGDKSDTIYVVGQDTKEAWYKLETGEWVAAALVDNAPSNAPVLATVGCNEVAATATVPPTNTPLPPTATTKPTATTRLTRRPTSTPRPTRTKVLPTATPATCDIKGNISYNTGEKIYHVPGQQYYSRTKINTSYGERWFCTEAEARAAGWRRSKR